MRAFGLVFLGILFSQAIAAVLPLVLTRFLTPEEMGVIAGLTAVVGVFGGVAHLRFANVINIADDESEALALERGSILITALVSVLCLLVLVGLDLAGVPQVVQWRPWSYFIPAWVFTTALYTSKTEVFVFQKNYHAYSLINVIRSLVTVLLHVPILWTGGIFIPMAAKTLGELVPFVFLRQRRRAPVLAVRPVLKKYLHYSLHDTPIYLMTLLSKNMIFFAVGAFYSLATLGVFSIGYKVFKIPLSIVGESIRKVLERKLKDHVGNVPRFGSLLYRSMAGLSLVVLALCLGVVFFIDDAFALFFDSRWADAGDYVIALLPAMGLHLLTTPYQSAYKVQGQMKVLTRMQTAQSVLVVIAIAWGSTTTALNMVWAFSLGWMVSFLYLPFHDLALNGLNLRQRP